MIIRSIKDLRLLFLIIICFISECCQNYLEENGELPDRIIMYRDGVGEGQLREVFDVELKKISVRQ